MKKFFIKISVVLAIVLIALYFLTKHLENRFINNNNNKTTWIINRSGDTVDYAFLGSSKVYNIIDIKTFTDSSDISAINLGTAGSSYIDNYLLLENYLKKNIVKNLILEADYFALNPHVLFTYPFHDFLFIPFMDKDQEINKIIKDNSSTFNYYKWKYIPVSRYLEFNSIYLKPENFGSYKFNPLFDEFGTQLITEPSKNFQIKAAERKITPDSNTINYIQKIIDLCRTKNINVILLTVPHYYELYNEFDIEMVKNILPELAQKNNIRYINFEGDALENKKELFYDYNHLKKEGAIIFTEQLKDSLLVN